MARTTEPPDVTRVAGWDRLSYPTTPATTTQARNSQPSVADGDIPDPKTRLAEALQYIGEQLGRQLTAGEIRELGLAYEAEAKAICGACGGVRWLMTNDGNLKACQTCSGPEPLNRRLTVAGFLPGEIPAALHAFKPERQPKGPALTQAKAALEHVGKWVKGTSAPTMLITGKTGTGKTLLAHGAALELCNRRLDVVITSGARFAEYMRRFEDGTADRYRPRLRSCAWLVFDDMGSGGHDPSGYLSAEYEALIDERYRMARPTLVTTNLSEADLTAVAGLRAVSRLYDTSRSAQVVMKDCVDLRRATR